MTQTYENHSRTVPLYHQVAFPILALNLLYGVYRAVRWASLETAMGALVAVALLILFFYARIFRADGAGSGDSTGDDPAHGTAASCGRARARA